MFHLFSYFYSLFIGKLAPGENYIKTVSDKSNSVAMFLRIQTDIEIKCHVKATFSLKYGGK